MRPLHLHLVAPDDLECVVRIEEDSSVDSNCDAPLSGAAIEIGVASPLMTRIEWMIDFEAVASVGNDENARMAASALAAAPSYALCDIGNII